MLRLFSIFLGLLTAIFALWYMLSCSAKAHAPFAEAIRERTNVPQHERSYEEAFNLAEVHQYGKLENAVNPDVALDLYREALEKSPDSKSQGDCHMGIGSLYENEIVPPDAPAAIAAYLNALECGLEEAGLRIAKIYTYGMHPHYLPNKMEAIRLYKSLESRSPTLRPWCRLAVREIGALRYDADALVQEQHRALPDDIVGAVIDRIKNRKAELVPYKQAPPWVDSYIDEEEHELDLLEEDAREIVEHKIPKQRIRNDSQNVHDHAMLNAANNNLNLVDTNQDSEQAYLRCTKALRSSLSSDGRKVLDSLSSNLHSRFDKSERDALLVVWERIHSPENEARKDDMLKVLRENLESGVESGHVVCSTGKIMRILSTLEVLDDRAQVMRPEWAIREEIGRKVGLVLQKKLESADQSVREAYIKSEPSPKEQELAEALRDRVRREVERSCFEEYKGVLEAERLSLLIHSILEFI